MEYVPARSLVAQDVAVTLLVIDKMAKNPGIKANQPPIHTTNAVTITHTHVALACCWAALSKSSAVAVRASILFFSWMGQVSVPLNLFTFYLVLHYFLVKRARKGVKVIE